MFSLIGNSEVSTILFWFLIVLTCVFFIACLIVILVVKPMESQSTSSSTQSSSSSSDTSTSTSSSSQSFPVGGCGEILYNFDTDLAFWISKDNNNVSCIPTMRLSDQQNMIQYTLEQANLATQDVYGADLIVRTGGSIQPNPVLPGPVINTIPIERLRISNAGDITMTSDTISIPNSASSFFYFGIPNTNGSWRIHVDSINGLFLFQAFIIGNYVTKFTITI